MCGTISPQFAEAAQAVGDAQETIFIQSRSHRVVPAVAEDSGFFPAC